MGSNTLIASEKSQYINLTDSNVGTTENYQNALAMLDVKINHYRKQYLIEWEKNHATERAPFDEKIAALKIKKNSLIKLYAEAKASRTSLSIDCSMEIKLK